MFQPWIEVGRPLFQPWIGLACVRSQISLRLAQPEPSTIGYPISTIAGHSEQARDMTSKRNIFANTLSQRLSKSNEPTPAKTNIHCLT